jgi:hypothetical protein
VREEGSENGNIETLQGRNCSKFYSSLRECNNPPPQAYGADCEEDDWEAEKCEGIIPGNCGKLIHVLKRKVTSNK